MGPYDGKVTRRGRGRWRRLLDNPKAQRRWSRRIDRYLTAQGYDVIILGGSRD